MDKVTGRLKELQYKVAINIKKVLQEGHAAFEMVHITKSGAQIPVETAEVANRSKNWHWKQ